MRMIDTHYTLFIEANYCKYLNLSADNGKNNFSADCNTVKNKWNITENKFENIWVLRVFPRS